MADTAQDAIVRRFGAFEVNLQSGELRKNGMRLRLSGQPFQVLAVLIERAGEVVTREELHSKLWPAETFVDFDHGLNNAVARIRDVLEDSSTTPRYVETVPKRGYRFIASLIDVRASTVGLPAANPELMAAPPDGSALEEKLLSDLAPREPLISKRLSILFLAALAVVAIAAALVLYQSRARNPAKQGIRSLAVLPLKNLSGDPNQEYLADGMTEELIGRLAGIHDLRVISRTSVMRFKQGTLSAPEIASMLHVDALVEGSVIRDGSRIRIHAQLIRADKDEHFWSESYDREMGDALTLESDVAQAIAERVKVTVTGQERTRLVVARHVSPEVYETYLKGEFGSRNTRADLEQSVAYFEDALRKDSAFAPAYVGLAKAYTDLGTIAIGAPPSVTRAKVMNAARKALELDPNLAEAHALLANGYQREWRWSEAEAEYKRALDLKPNDIAAHVGFARWLDCQGRSEEALAWARHAHELDPLGDSGPLSLVEAGPGIEIAAILFYARRYDEAIQQLRSSLAIHPDFAWARWSVGRALIEKGRPEEAIPELQKAAFLMQRSPGALAMLGYAYAHAGRRAEAVALLDELKRRRETRYVPAGAFVLPNLALHEYNEAFSWLERAYAEKSTLLQFLKIDPMFDPIRGDARFQDLVRRVGLE